MESRRRKRGKLNRRGRRRVAALLLAVLLMLTAIGLALFQLWDRGMLPANRPAAHWYDTSGVSKALVHFPQDDGPHENLTEWWYYNGHVSSQDGKRYSFHLALFLIDRLTRFTVFHASFLDHQTGKHFTTQQRTAGVPDVATGGGFDFRLGQWRLKGANGHDQISVGTPDFTIDLDLISTTAPILHGETGLLDFKDAGSSYYYSRPRMMATGKAGPTGQARPVRGEVWYDHQWGDFSVKSLGWNWYALQLDDGRDLMLFELFTSTGEKVVHFGTISRRDVLQTLHETDFSTRATGRWKSPSSSIVFPMGWTVSIPSAGMKLDVKPVSPECEFDGRASAYKVYWEGAVKVSGSHSGQGFVEMSGYKAQEHPRASR